MLKCPPLVWMHTWKRLQHWSISWRRWTEAAPREGLAWLGTVSPTQWMSGTNICERIYGCVFNIHAKGGHFEHLMWLESTHMLMFRSIYIVLNTSRVLSFFYFFCISQDSVVTRLRCGGKYNTSLVANLLLSSTVKEFLKSANISQSYEQISSDTFLWTRV